MLKAVLALILVIIVMYFSLRILKKYITKIDKIRNASRNSQITIDQTLYIDQNNKIIVLCNKNNERYVILLGKNNNLLLDKIDSIKYLKQNENIKNS